MKGYLPKYYGIYLLVLYSIYILLIILIESNVISFVIKFN